MNINLKVGVKVLLNNKEGKCLVLSRSALKYPEVGGQWDIPGGRIHPGTILLENLRREVREETGLEIEGEPELLYVQDILKQDQHIVRITYTGFAEGAVKLSDEHTDYRWLTIDEISALEPLDRYLKELLANFDLG